MGEIMTASSTLGKTATLRHTFRIIAAPLAAADVP
jgi:hypothetical protein